MNREKPWKRYQKVLCKLNLPTFKASFPPFISFSFQPRDSFPLISIGDEFLLSIPRFPSYWKWKFQCKLHFCARLVICVKSSNKSVTEPELGEVKWGEKCNNKVGDFSVGDGLRNKQSNWKLYEKFTELVFRLKVFGKIWLIFPNGKFMWCENLLHSSFMRII